MILVTGATGLVGSHLVWHLLQKNDKIRATIRKTGNTEALRTVFSFYTNTPDTYLNRIEWIIADVNDKNSIRNAMINITEVYHCAAVVSLGNESETLITTNVTGTGNVVEAALETKIKKFCFVSSIAACGKPVNSNIIDENCIRDENSSGNAYAKSKYYSELEVWKGINKGLNAVIVNPGVILGVSGNTNGSAELFYRVKKGMPFYTLGGTGYVAVKDVVKTMILLMESNISGERFIISAENRNNREILSWIAKGFGKHAPFINISEKTLLTVGFISEIFGKITGKKTLLDRSLARSALNREFYSSDKLIKTLHFEFIDIKSYILEICDYMKK